MLEKQEYQLGVAVYGGGNQRGITATVLWIQTATNLAAGIAFVYWRERRSPWAYLPVLVPHVDISTGVQQLDRSGSLALPRRVDQISRPDLLHSVGSRRHSGCVEWCARVNVMELSGGGGGAREMQPTAPTDTRAGFEGEGWWAKRAGR